MKKWLGTGLVVLALTALILAAAAFTARWWLEPLLTFLGTNSNEIQALADLIQIILWALTALTTMATALLGWRRRKTGDSPTSTIAPHAETGEGGVAVAGGEIAGGQVGVVRGVEGDVIIVNSPAQIPDRTVLEPPNVNLQPATAAYRQHLRDRYRYLDFRGMGVTDKIPLRLSLTGMYVPLRARIEMPEGETWARDLHLAGRKLSDAEIENVGRKLSEPQPVLDLLRDRDGLIILGDPGAGKTTFLKYLTLKLAEEAGDALGLDNRLPVLVPLSAYAIALNAGNVPLDEFIVGYHKERGIELPLALLTATLDAGGALLLLDGLDEVKAQHLRQTVVDRVVDFFTVQRRRGNKFILTSRIVGYRAVRSTVEGLEECTLVDFDQAEIEQFIHKWTHAIESAAHGDTQMAVSEAEREQAELLDAVRRNPGVRRLAANPLLLTILALMKRQGVSLPERRVELYEKYVETLLKQWNLARSLGRPLQYELDVVETTRVLAPLALWMHEVSPGIGLVPRVEMERTLEKIYADRGVPEPDAAARRFLADVHEHTGLLLARGAQEYGFIHLTFQEYLAAVAIAGQGQESVTPVVETLAAHVGDQSWHEASLLAVAYMGIIQRRDKAAGAVVSGLIEREPGDPEEAGENVVLAGEAVLDAWPGGVTHGCRTHVIDALLQTLRDDQHVKPARRAAAGRVLAKLGDPRPEVLDPLCIEWIDIPAGPFVMGSEDTYPSDRPRHEVDLGYAFKISRFPITNAQFKKFVDAGGYGEERYWTEAEANGRWRDGKVIRGLYRWVKKDGKETLEEFKTEEGTEPANFGEPYNLPNHPVVGVNWYEVLAFSRWLTETLRTEGILTKEQAVHLPSEAEWERAARGTAGRVYPYDGDPDSNRVNCKEIGLEATSTVGAFPGGATPGGVEEMSGNVWEWTRNLWGTDVSDPEHVYPYVADDGRESLAAGDKVLRILRGGSCFDEHNVGRCAVRFGYYPYFRLNFFGVRVVVVASPHCPTDH